DRARSAIADVFRRSFARAAMVELVRIYARRRWSVVLRRWSAVLRRAILRRFARASCRAPCLPSRDERPADHTFRMPTDLTGTPTRGSAGLVDILDRVLDKGLVVAGDIK